MEITSYKDLVVWQKAMKLATLTYKITQKFPSSELYGIVSQMRRSAVSIPSNLAEGSRRGSRKDFRQFVLIAFGSGAELETQLEIAKTLTFGDATLYAEIEALLNEVMKMLNKLAHSL